MANDKEYHELEKENSPNVKGDYQEIDIPRNPPEYQEVKPSKADNLESSNQPVEKQNIDKETDNPYYNPSEIDDKSIGNDDGGPENALYEEVMEEYNRITSLPRDEKNRVLGDV